LNAETFAESVRPLKKLLYHISFTILRNDDDAMDAVQEALLTAWQMRSSLRDENAFRPWLSRILCNVCYGMIRRRRPTLTLLETVPAPERSDSGLPEALENLADELRLPVVLHYLDGYSLKEVGEMMDISEGAVKNRLFRARQKLRGLLDDLESTSNREEA